MAKKKYQDDTNTDAPVAVEPAAPEQEAPAAEEAPKAFIRPSSHLVCETADHLGRTAYRFAKSKEMPKKAPQVDITIDGKPAKIAFTTSGGYSEKVGYNAYIQKPTKEDGSPGDIGWILFNDDVNPTDPEQFPNGVNFVTVAGQCAANPVRQPKNLEGEMNRRKASAEAAKAKAAKRAEEAAAEAKPDVNGDPDAQPETTEGLDATQ